MIKWECNFNIEDSTVQVPVALVKVNNFINVSGTSKIDIIISGESEEIVIKEYQIILEQEFNNKDEVYAELVKRFDNSIII